MIGKVWNRPKKRGELYTKTLLTLYLLSLFTIVFMFFFVSRIVARNQQDRLNQFHEDQLTRISVDVDLVFTGMEETVNQLLRTNNAIVLMVNPEVKDSNTAYQEVSSLQNAVAQNHMIKSAVLYLPLTEEVYSYEGSYVNLSESDFRTYIEAYLQMREEGRKSGSECEVRILHQDSRIFLAGDFCVPNFIGALLLEIDRDQLTAFLSGSEDSTDEDYFLLDQDLQVIYAVDGREKDLTGWLAGKSRQDLLSSGNRTDEYLFYPSAKYPILYGYHPGNVEAQVSPMTVIMTLLPFLIVYAIFSQIFASYITRKVYEPIKRLMKITTGKHSQDDSLEDQNRNELEILESSFRDALGENEQQKELLNHISEDVTEQVFRGIIMMTNTDMEQIRKTMTGIGLGEYLTGKYQSLACLVKPADDRPLSTVEEGLYRRSLLTIFDECDPEDHLMVSFFVDSEYLAVLLCMPEEFSVLQIKTRVQKLMDDIGHETEGLPYSVLFGKGKIYNDITSLRFSYREAAEEVSYLDYQANGSQTPERRTGDYDRRYFAERAEHLAESAEKEKLEDVLKTSDSLAAELWELSEEDRTRYLEQIIDILVERMIQSHVTSEEIQAMNLNVILEELEHETDFRSGLEKIQEMFGVAVKAIHTNSRKNRFRYVDTAMEYIAAHYADGNLSLNEVSEAVGISAPYLSGIFAEVNKGGFSSYISNYRVEQAKRFLTETTESVSEIGYKCGFNSAQSFSRVFKKYTGISPGQYREKSRKRSESISGGSR